MAQLAHLGGALVGWIYVHAINRAARPFTVRSLRKEREELERRRLQAPRAESREREAAEVVAESKPLEPEGRRVDAILDKISEEGMQSLTSRERKILEESSEKLSRKADRR